MVLVSVVHNRKKVVWLEKNGRFSEQAGLYFDRRATYLYACVHCTYVSALPPKGIKTPSPTLRRDLDQGFFVWKIGVKFKRGNELA